MNALDVAVPSTLASALGLFIHPRSGLDEPAVMPHIERVLTAARLDPAWLEQYCACVGLAARRSRLIPPLSLQIAAAPLHLAILADPRFPFRALGLVHVSQVIRQRANLHPSSRFDLLAYSTEARLEKRGISFGLITEARHAGELVWQSEVRALSMSKTQRAVQSPEPGALDRPAEHDPEAFDHPLAPVTEEVIDVPERCGRDYARIAGDLNPIHQHALLARPFGFRRAIAHGTWVLARALASASLPDWVPYEIEATFRRPVELPATIRVAHYRGAASDERVLQVVDPASGKTHIAITVRSLAGR